MDHRKLSDMLGLLSTRQITAFEFHLFLADNSGSPEAKQIMALMSELLTQSITQKQFFDRAFRVASSTEVESRPASNSRSQP